MNNGKWKQEEECFVRENAGKKTLEEMAKHIGKSNMNDRTMRSLPFDMRNYYR